MTSTRNHRYLSLAVALAGAIAAAWGIFSTSGPGEFIHTAITGQQTKSTFAEGMRRSVRWIEEHPDRKLIVDPINDLTDKLIAVMERVKP